MSDDSEPAGDTDHEMPDGPPTTGQRTVIPGLAEYWKDLELQGVVLHVTEDGKTEHIERIRFPVEKNEAQPYNNGSHKNGSHSNGNSERLQHSNER